MRWQDTVLSLGSLIFVAALVPTVRGPEKPPLSTSFVTSTVLAAFAVAYVTMALWFSAATTTLNALMWLTLAAQRRGRG